MTTSDEHYYKERRFPIILSILLLLLVIPIIPKLRRITRSRILLCCFSLLFLLIRAVMRWSKGGGGESALFLELDLKPEISQCARPLSPEMLFWDIVCPYQLSVCPSQSHYSIFKTFSLYLFVFCEHGVCVACIMNLVQTPQTLCLLFNSKP